MDKHRLVLEFALAPLPNGNGHIFQELYVRILHYHCGSLFFLTFCARAIAVSIEYHVAASAEVFFLYSTHRPTPCTGGGMPHVEAISPDVVDILHP